MDLFGPCHLVVYIQEEWNDNSCIYTLFTSILIYINVFTHVRLHVSSPFLLFASTVFSLLVLFSWVSVIVTLTCLLSSSYSIPRSILQVTFCPLKKKLRSNYPTIKDTDIKCSIPWVLTISHTPVGTTHIRYRALLSLQRVPLCPFQFPSLWHNDFLICIFRISFTLDLVYMELCHLYSFMPANFSIPNVCSKHSQELFIAFWTKYELFAQVFKASHHVVPTVLSQLNSYCYSPTCIICFFLTAFSHGRPSIWILPLFPAIQISTTLSVFEVHLSYQLLHDFPWSF